VPTNVLLRSRSRTTWRGRPASSPTTRAGISQRPAPFSGYPARGKLAISPHPTGAVPVRAVEKSTSTASSSPRMTGDTSIRVFVERAYGQQQQHCVFQGWVACCAAFSMCRRAMLTGRNTTLRK